MRRILASLLPSVRGLPRAYWMIWIGTLINRTGGFVAPFLALYLTEQRKLNVEEAGFIVALFGAGQLAAGFIGGALSDRFGRKPTLIGSLTLGPAAMLTLAFAREPSHIAVCTFVLGLLGDFYRPASTAAIVDLVPEADRSRAFGLMYWAINLGFAIGPVLAGALASQRFELLFFGDAATTLAYGMIVIFFLPETRPKQKEEAAARRFAPFAPFRDVIYMAFAALNFLLAVVFNQSIASLPMDMSAHGISNSELGVLIGLNGVCIVLLQPFSLALIQKRRRAHVLALASVLVGAGFALNWVSTTPVGYGIAVVVWTLGEITMAPVPLAIAADLSPPDLRGSYQGVLQMSWGAASFAAPWLGSMVMARFGSDRLWIGCGLVGLLIAGAQIVLGGDGGMRLEARSVDHA